VRIPSQPITALMTAFALPLHTGLRRSLSVFTIARWLSRQARHKLSFAYPETAKRIFPKGSQQ
jgi:hypothetical protein